MPSNPFAARVIVGVHSAAGSAREVATPDLLRRSLFAEEGLERTFADDWTVVGATGPRAGPAHACFLDGRVDNIAELRAEFGLPEASPPEETLWAAYMVLRERVLTRIRGRFAIVIWDGSRRQGLAAVDQFGSRPLFYSASGSVLRFASEVRNLDSLLPVRPPPNTEAVLQWLVVGETRPAETHFRGVQRLSGAHFLHLGNPPFEPVRYWRPRYRSPSTAPRATLVHDIREAITNAVSTRMPDDGGPVGVLMSGGLDSSSVAAVANRLEQARGSRIRAYSAVFPEHPSVDESSRIGALESHLGISVRRGVVSGGSMLGASLEFLRAWWIPSLTPNLYFLLPLQRAAYGDGVRVILDGSGGDEVFGCAPFLIADRVKRLRFDNARRLTAELPFGEVPGPRTVRHYLREIGYKGAVPYFLHRPFRAARTRRTTPPWLNESSARIYNGSRVDPWAWKSARGPLWWRYLAYTLTVSRELFSIYDMIRRTHQLTGLHAAHPLMDDLDLIELALSIPPEMLFSQQHSRPLLREAMAGLLPGEVRLQPSKAIFTALLREHLTGKDGDDGAALLLRPDAEINAYVQPDAVRMLLERARRGEELGTDLWVVWRLIVTECWLQSQKDPPFAERALAEWNLPEPDVEIRSADGAAVSSTVH